MCGKYGDSSPEGGQSKQSEDLMYVGTVEGEGDQHGLSKPDYDMDEK